MFASFRAFMHQTIDYAGLFPPAKLPLDVALAEYLHHKKTSPHRWMLGKFVCPAARLPELLPLAKSHADAALLRLSVLGQACAQLSDFVPRVGVDLQAIEDFRRAWADAAVIDTYEVALPKGARLQTLTASMPLLESRIKQANLRMFLEIPLMGSAAFDAEQIAELRAICSIGVKLRAGGLTADAFPSDAQAACFIDRCRSAKLPWKATAGLHHPVRHWDQSLQLWHHGFLNVVGAGLLAMAHPLTPADLIAILSDREGTHCRFDEERFAWKDWSCTADQITDFRASGPTSFGTCSFAEPCADLTAMGLLSE